ncbi:MAG: DoxX-like family protein [Burkholderiaceae bacterium]
MISAFERWSLVGLWWGTALVSLLGWGGISHRLVDAPGWVPEALGSALVAGGVAVDVAVGSWLAVRPGPLAYRTALAVVVLFTLLASAMVPGEWLHPLGPLLKNLPIAALLWRGCAWSTQGETQ